MDSSPELQTRISLMATGLLLHLHTTGATRITLADIQQAEPGGMSRERASRLADELRRGRYLHRTSTGYALIHPGELGVMLPFAGFTDITTSPTSHPTFDSMHKTPDQNQNPGAVETLRDVCEVTISPHHVFTPADTTRQEPLDGMPEAPSPVAAPPSPAKPKRGRPPPAAAEIRALYPLLFDLTKSPRLGKRAMAVYTIARNLWAEFAATPAQLETFWAWFKMFSPAATAAAKERRPLNPPMPRQVYEAWPQFLPWWQAQQAHTAREAARVVFAPEPPVVAAGEPETPAERRARIDALHPFRRFQTAPPPGAR